MKRLSIALLVVGLMIFGGAAFAQVDVTATTGTPSASYTTLKGAFDAINAGTQGGVLTIGISGNTTETAPAVLNYSGSGAALYTSVTISPTGGAARTISGAIAAGSPLIDLNGADYVTIDGLNSGSNSLTIANTTASATSATSTIRFIGGATNNLITRCSIQGSFSAAVATNGGDIFFSTDANTANGNDNNTISYCDIGPAGANLPTKCVYINGSTTTTAIGDSGNLIDNNTIHDWFGAAVTSAGIYVAGGNTDNNFTNNKFYQTATRTQTTGTQHSAIWIANSSGNNYQVTGNIIGYATSSQTGTYTFVGLASSKFVPIYLNVGTTTATSVQGNTIAGIAMSGVLSGTSSSAPFMGVYVSSGLAYIGATSAGASGTGNTIGSLGSTGSITYTSSSTSATELIGTFNFGSSNWIVMNNNIGGITGANSSTGAVSFYGIRCYTSTSATTLVQNNTIGGTVANSIQTTNAATATIMQGFYAQSCIATVTGNTIRNMTEAGGTGATATPAMGGIVLGTSSANHTVSQNVIHSLSNTNATTTGHITGIMYQGSTGTNLIERNLIHSLNAASATAVINGIFINAGTSTYQNNMVRLGFDASGTPITTGCAINGINETVAGTDNMYFNSVFIGGAGVGGTANTFAFQSSIITNTRNYKDNIFWNNRGNGAGTGKHYAIRVGGAAANPAGLTCDYNDLLADGTGGVFGLFNAVDQANMAAWRTATGQDGASLSANPQFIAPNGSALAGDIHVSLIIPTPIEGAGLAIGSVTNDYDNQLRASFSPTDIGADCDNFVPSDISPPAIVYTPLGNTCSVLGETLVTTITDATGVPQIGIGLPVIYWNVNGGLWTATPGVWSAPSTYTFTFGAPVVPGDVVRYYIVAQDTVVPPNIGCQPAGGAGGFTANPPAAAIPPTTPSSYTVLPTLAAGTYSIPGAYATLTAAVAAYNTNCLGGAIVFELAAGYSSAGETFPIVIGASPNASPVNTLTIRPAATTVQTISGAAASGGLIKLNGADYVTIDGSNSGGTDRSLTITNTSATSPCGIWIASLGNGAGATNDVVKNCIITTTAGGTAYGVTVSGSTISAAGGDNDNVTIQNNAINSVNYGVFAYGNAAVSAGGMDNLLVSGNAFTSTSTQATLYGVEIFGALNASVTGNSFNLTTNASGQPVGISLETNVSNSSVTANQIIAVVTTATGGYGGRGITVGTNTTAANITVANNFVAGVNGSNYSGFGNSSSMGIGLGVQGGVSITTTSGGIKLYHNTINMYGTYVYSSACNTAGLYVGSGASALDIRNNIFVNTMTNTSAVSKNYAVYSAAASTAFAPISYNDYYVGAAQGVLGYLGADQTTLAAFNTAFTGNPATPAYTVSVPFPTNTNLHIPAATASLLESGGVDGLMAVDIDNEARPGPPGSVNGGGTHADVGADEFDGIPAYTNDMAATAFIVPTNGGSASAGVAFDPQASFTNAGLAAQTDVPVRYRIVGPSPSTSEVYNQPGSIPSIASLATATVTFPSATISAEGTYTIYAKAELVGDQAAVNDQVTGTITVLQPLAGTYLVGTSVFKQATGLDLTFVPQVEKVKSVVLEPVDPADTKGGASGQIAFKSVEHEYDRVTYVPMLNGQKYEGRLGVDKETNPGLPPQFESGAYATITAAVADLNARGVSAAVTFLLTDATYPSETFPITVNVAAAPPTATNTVTIKPNAGVTTTVSGASASGPLFKIFKTNYVTIDGSKDVSGTSRDLTLENTSATSPNVVVFGSSGTTPITNGTLKNCVILNGISSSAVVISDGTVLGNAGYFSNMEIRNNKIERAYIGVYATGGTTPQSGFGLVYAQNEINTSGTNNVTKSGLYMQGVNGATVTGNDVGNFETATGENDAGIWLATGTMNATVSGNRVHDLRYTGTSGYGPKGIEISTGVTGANITVVNNFVYNIGGDGDSFSSYGGTYCPEGIYALGTQDGLHIYDNSIYMYGSMINYSAGAYSIGIGLDDASNADVSGNCVENNLGRLSTLGAGAVALCLETASTQLTSGDHNNLYCNSNMPNLVGKIAATDYATMAAWRTASGRDANSITADPLYVSTTDLHIRTDVASPVNNVSAPIDAITTDIDGDARMTAADIGADETYTLATTVVDGGSIGVVPSQTSYQGGASVTLTATPVDSCHVFTAWSGDFVGNTNPLAIVMNANKSYTATFAIKTFEIAASAGGGGGIAPSGTVTVNCGSSPEFIITPNLGYHVVDVKVDDVSQGAIGSYTFSNVQANHTIAATFAIDTFTLTPSANAGGTITPDTPQTVNYGGSQEFTIAASACHHIVDVKVDNVSQGVITTYTFSDVQANHTIEAIFAIDTFVITATAGTGGTIDPNGSVVVNCGSDQGFTIAANLGYRILDVLVDTVSQGAIATYTFTNVTAAHTIDATFEAVPVQNLETGLQYTTIQSAIDAPQTLDGHTLQIGTGTFEEQVVVTKDLTLKGMGCESTVIKSPVVLTASFSTPSVNKPIVFVNGKSNVTIQDLTVDGAGRGNSNYKFSGIAFWNGGGKVAHVCVINVEDTPFSGAQHGVGVYTYNNTGGPYALELDHVTVTDFQKTAMALNGDGLTVNVHDCTTTGKGYTSVTAQNGIQVGYGAGGTVTNCKISDIGYSGPSWTASGLLAYACGSPLAVSGLKGANLISNAQAPVSWYDTNGSMDGIEVSGGSDWGPIFIYNSQATSKQTSSTLRRAPLAPVSEEGWVARAKSSLFTVSVTNSCLNGTSVAGTAGIGAYTEGGGLEVTATNNVVTGWDVGFTNYGTAAVLTANINSVTGNLSAGYDNTGSATAQNAENNWWGAADGPSGAGSGSGQAVLGTNVDFTPWLTTGTNTSGGCGFIPRTPVTNLDTGLSYMTIQAALDAVQTVDGNTIRVLSGTFEEQVVITKDVTIEGAGCDSTIIKSPAVLTASFNTGSINKPVVFVNGKSNVTIQDLAVDGAGRGNANAKFDGIAFWNGGGKVARVCVERVRNTPWDGAQHGVGVYAYNNTGGPYTLEVDHVTVSDFQKNGMALNGDGLVVNVHDCTVLGSGYTGITAQNCIQVSYGAGGTISDCTISDVGYTGAGWSSSGILTYACGSAVTLSGMNGSHVITNCQDPVSWYDTDGSMSGIEVAAGADWGPIFIYNSQVSDKNHQSNLRHRPLAPLSEEGYVSPAKSAGYTVSVSNSCLTGVNGPTTVGIFAYTEGAPLTVTATNNVVHNWGYGFGTYGDAAILTANLNSIAGNTYAGYDNTGSASAQNAENNWWGAANGPSGAGAGSGDAVLGTGVDFDPWLGSGTNTASGCGFVPKVWVITATANAGGSIDPVGAVNVYEGNSQGFTITANPGYHIVDVKVDNLSQGAIGTYTFTDVVADHTIDVTFAVSNHTITATAGPGGTIDPSGAVIVADHGTQAFTIAANPCYQIVDVKVDNVSQGAIATYTFTDVVADHTIDATFAITTYTLALPILQGGHLTAVPAKPLYDCGDSVTVTAIADPGWAFDHWTVDASGAVNPLHIVMTSNKTIGAVFADIQPPTVQVLLPNGGEVWDAGTLHNITWTATDNNTVSAIDLAYSTDGGATFPYVIATGLANSGTHPWTVPFTYTKSARVRATAHDPAGHSTADASDANWEIGGPASAVANTMFGQKEGAGVYPNPANASGAHVLFQINTAASVGINIYDVTGHLVRVLTNGSRTAGVHNVAWNGLDENGNPVAAGIYLIRVNASTGMHETKRLVLYR